MPLQAGRRHTTCPPTSASGVKGFARYYSNNLIQINVDEVFVFQGFLALNDRLWAFEFCTYPRWGSKHFLEYNHIQPVNLDGYVPNPE